MAERIAAVVLQNRAVGAYADTLSPVRFAARLTADLQSVSGDKHLLVSYEPLAGGGGSRPTAKIVARPRGPEYLNFGFRRLERLPGNVGLLELSVFVDPRAAARTLAASMQWLANTDGLIIDLRDNDGGSPNMASVFTSYFVDSVVGLTGIYSRSDRRLHKQVVRRHVAGPKYLRKPVVVVTSSVGTVSAAEAFTYNLVSLHRALVVGEVTAGAANPGYTERLSSEFTIFVPTGRAVNPITGGNWEGKGISPDVPVVASRALAEAYRVVLDSLLRTTTGETERASIQRALDRPVPLR